MMRARLIWMLLLLLAMPLIVRAESKPLPETYVSDDQSITFRYPTGWVVESDQPGTLFVATSHDLLDWEDDTVPLGEALVVITFFDDQQGYLRDYLGSEGLAGMVNTLIDSAFTGEDDLQVEFSEPSATTFAGFSAIRSDGLFQGNHVFIILSERDDNIFNFVIGGTNAAEFDKYEPKLLAIAESAQYMQPSQ